MWHHHALHCSNDKPAEAPVKQEGFWTKVKDWVTGAKDREKVGGRTAKKSQLALHAALCSAIPPC